MQKIEHDLTITIEESGALAEVIIPAFELNDIRRERDEYLAQTASDLYDRVVYMVRSQRLENDPDEEVDGPTLRLTMEFATMRASVTGWRETRRERQESLKENVVALFKQQVEILDFLKRTEHLRQ